MKHRIQHIPALTLTCAVLAASFNSQAEQVTANSGDLEFSGDSAIFALTAPSGHPTVVVDLGDGKKNVFIVDTGAGVNVLDSAVAESLGLEIVGEMQIGAPGGPQIPGHIVRLPHATIGGATINGAEFVTMDLAKFTGGSMQGVLGLGLFREYLLTYDYGQNEIRVSRESLGSDEDNVLPYSDPDGHIQIDMDVAGTTVATHVDTGSMVGFTLPIELKESLTLKAAKQGASKAHLVGGDRNIHLGQLDGDIVLAGSRYEDPKVGFMDPSPGFGNVGSRVLSDFVVSVDQKRHLIRFNKSDRKLPVVANNQPRQLGVQFRGVPGGSLLTIGQVDPGSLGELSGLLSGDVIHELNGKPSEDYDMASLGALFRGGEALQMQVSRDGEMKTIEIQ